MLPPELVTRLLLSWEKVWLKPRPKREVEPGRMKLNALGGKVAEAEGSGSNYELVLSSGRDDGSYVDLMECWG